MGRLAAADEEAARPGGPELVVPELLPRERGRPVDLLVLWGRGITEPVRGRAGPGRDLAMPDVPLVERALSAVLLVLFPRAGRSPEAARVGLG